MILIKVPASLGCYNDKELIAVFAKWRTYLSICSLSDCFSLAFLLIMFINSPRCLPTITTLWTISSCRTHLRFHNCKSIIFFLHCLCLSLLVNCCWLAWVTKDFSCMKYFPYSCFKEKNRQYMVKKKKNTRVLSTQ